MAGQLLVHLVEGTPNDETTDFRSASANLIELGVTKNAAGGVVIDVTVAAWGRGAKVRQRGKGEAEGQK